MLTTNMYQILALLDSVLLCMLQRASVLLLSGFHVDYTLVHHSE